MKPKLYKFYSETCPPCTKLAPIVDNLKQEYPDIEFIDIDIKQNQELVSNLQVKSVPTMVFVRDNKEQSRIVGLVDKVSIKENLNLLLE